MNNFNFGEVLSSAWKIAWRFRVLWIFGILASCANNQGGGGNFSNSNYSFSNDEFDLDALPITPEQERMVQQFFVDFANNAMWYLLGFFIFLLILSLAVFAIGVMGRTGLIYGAARADAGARELPFGLLWTNAMRPFWRVFILGAVLGLPVVLVIFLTGATLFLGIAGAIDTGSEEALLLTMFTVLPIFLGCLCIIWIIYIPIALIVRQADNAIVLEDMGIIEAVQRGWDVFRNNLGPVFLMGVLLWIIQTVVGILLSIPFIVLMLPLVFGFVLLGGVSSYLPFIIGAICLVVLIPVMWLASGILNAYIESAWTLTYIRLTNYASEQPVTLEYA
jgi:hypothetical protein